MANEPKSSCVPTPSSHWFSEAVGNEPPHEMLVSETRAVQEAYAELGCGATPDAVCRLLKDKGMDVDRAMVERIFQSCRTEA